MRAFTAALIQMSVTAGDKQRNLAHAVDLIAEARAAGADLVLLPETMDLGWLHPSARQEAEPIPDGWPCRQLAAAARQHKVYVCSGLTERDGEHVYNSAILLDPRGRLLIRHRKLNELTCGHACYDQGDRLNVVHTELGTIGLMICADGFAPGEVLARGLCYMGADVILSPSAWAVPADHDNVAEPYGDTWRCCYKPVARDFQVWIIGVSNVGPITAGAWSGRHCIGCSLAIAPGGEELLQGPYGVNAEAILYLRIPPHPRPARGTGWHDLHPLS